MVRKIILYIATSSDGFIATKDGSVAWLDKYQEGMDISAYNDFLKSIDIVVMGNTTYKQILGFDCNYPYPNQKGYVFANKEGKDEHVTFVNGDVKKFAEQLEGNIWLVGGANIIRQFLQYNLIDEFIISVMPTELKEGIKLFPDEKWKENLVLEQKKEMSLGVIEYYYKKKSD